MIDYLPSLKQDRPPRLLVTCDFGHFMWHDLSTNQEGMFPLSDWVANLDLFWWLANHERRGEQVFVDEEEANLKATDLMAKGPDRGHRDEVRRARPPAVAHSHSLLHVR